MSLLENAGPNLPETDDAILDRLADEVFDRLASPPGTDVSAVAFLVERDPEGMARVSIKLRTELATALESDVRLPPAMRAALSAPLRAEQPEHGVAPVVLFAHEADGQAAFGLRWVKLVHFAGSA